MTENSQVQNCTYTGIPHPSKRSYRNLLSPVSQRLCEDSYVAQVARELGISKSLARYWKNKGLELHVLKEKTQGKPIFYDKGPCYNRYVDGGDSHLSAILSRVHLGSGSYYYYNPIRSGDEDGFESKASSSHYTIQTRDLEIPDSTIGYHGATTTLDLRTYLKPTIRQELRLTPPMVYRTYEDLLQEDDPFDDILNYTTNYLIRKGWNLPTNPTLTNTIHYSFEFKSLGVWIDDLLPHVEFLRREDGGEDSTLYIWLDNSQGHDRPELETSLKGIALDVFALDTVRRSVT